MRMDVWLESHDQRIGLLERGEDKSLTFTYGTGVSDAGRISLSLPVRAEPYTDAVCRGYFENLLFEGPQYDRVIASYQLERDDIGALLYHLGADCPGAISITPEGSGPAKRPGEFPNDYELIDEATMSKIVRSLHLDRRLPDLDRDPSPVAGVQGKIAIVFWNGEYYLPKVGSKAPTTHILKVAPKSEPALTVQEGGLLSMARTCRIKTTNFEAKTFSIDGHTINTILLERFDRSIENNHIRRIHAEDFCQAAGLAPSLKYERKSLSPDHKFSGKAIGSIAAKATVPGQFIDQFLGQTLYNLLVGNTDNHGKNTSVLHRHLGTELAPLYDVVPVFIDTNVTHQFAFDIGMAQFAEDLSQQHLLTLMRDIGSKNPRFDKRLLKKLRDFADVIAKNAEDAVGKGLADALTAQMDVVSTALNIDLKVPERDYFNRMTRDENTRLGGWNEIS